jgi:hypothetical protein
MLASGTLTPLRERTRMTMVGFLSYASEYLKLCLPTKLRFLLILYSQFGSFPSLTQMRSNLPAFSLPPCEAVGH